MLEQLLSKKRILIKRLVNRVTREPLNQESSFDALTTEGTGKRSEIT